MRTHSVVLRIQSEGLTKGKEKIMGKKWKEVSAGTLKAAEQRFWSALGSNAGLVADKINANPNYLKRLVYKAVDEALDYKPDPHPFTGDGTS